MFLAIKKRLLRNRGADVDFVSASPFKSAVLKAVNKLKRGWVVSYLEKISDYQ